MKKFILIAFLAIATFANAQNISNKITGNITTQNLVPTGNATANSAVEINCLENTQTIGVQVTGTYTSGAGGTLFGLIAQATVDGTTWNTINYTDFIRNSRNELISNIPSAENGTYYILNRGYNKVRICCTSGAVTGTAVVTLNISTAAFNNKATGAKYTCVNDGAGTAGNVPLIAITGINTKTIVVKKITVAGYNATAGSANRAWFVGRATGFAGGTSGGLTKNPYNPSSITTAATILGYSAVPTITGSSIIYQFSTYDGTTTLPSGNTLVIDFGEGIILNGTTQAFYLQNRSAIAGSSVTIVVDYEEI